MPVIKDVKKAGKLFKPNIIEVDDTTLIRHAENKIPQTVEVICSNRYRFTQR
jgi:hypothetical protein